VLRVVFLVPLLPLAGFVILLLSGRKLGNPRAGWLATLMVTTSFVVTVVVFIGLFRLPATRPVVHPDLVHLDLRGPPARQHGPARRPTVETMAGVRDGGERPSTSTRSATWSTTRTSRSSSCT